MASSSYDGGLPSETERISAGFQIWIREQLPVAGQRQEPPAGRVAQRNGMLSR